MVNKKRNNKDDTSQTIRECLENATDINAALAHRFEYHIFHAGDVHRIGRVNHEDIYPLIGEWVGKRVRQGNGAGMKLLGKPVHVFMDGNLWSVLEMKALIRGEANFKETSIMFGLIHEAEILEDRVLTWNPDEASESDEADEGGAD